MLGALSVVGTDHRLIADQQQARRAWILRHRTVARIIASSEMIGPKK
jgi:hypothetical protein